MICDRVNSFQYKGQNFQTISTFLTHFWLINPTNFDLWQGSNFNMAHYWPYCTILINLAVTCYSNLMLSNMLSHVKQGDKIKPPLIVGPPDLELWPLVLWTPSHSLQRAHSAPLHIMPMAVVLSLNTILLMYLRMCAKNRFFSGPIAKKKPSWLVRRWKGLD